MLAKTETKAPEMTSYERALINGDISKLTAAERESYYMAVCKRVGLDPLSQPFDYIQLNGKLTLYAKKSAKEQIRNNHNISIVDISGKFDNGIYIVTVRAQLPNGRSDIATGVVSVGKLQGDALANQMMKAETKAKARVTLSLVGLGMLEESEVDSIPNARKVNLTSVNSTIDVSDDSVALLSQQNASPPIDPPPIDPLVLEVLEELRQAQTQAELEAMAKTITNGMEEKDKKKYREAFKIRKDELQNEQSAAA